MHGVVGLQLNFIGQWGGSLKFEFYIIEARHKYYSSSDFFQSFKNVSIILSLQAIQKQAVGQDLFGFHSFQTLGIEYNLVFSSVIQTGYTMTWDSMRCH